MEREPGCPGVITATRGNHGQAVGLAARRFKLPATVYVPHGNGIGEERRHARAGRDAGRARPGFPGSARGSRARRRAARTAHGARLSPRPRAGRQPPTGRSCSARCRTSTWCTCLSGRGRACAPPPPPAMSIPRARKSSAWSPRMRLASRSPSPRVAWSKRRSKRCSAMAWPAANPTRKPWPSCSPTSAASSKSRTPSWPRRCAACLPSRTTSPKAPAPRHSRRPGASARSLAGQRVGARAHRRQRGHRAVRRRAGRASH